MKIEQQARDDHQVTLIVEFEPGALDVYKQRAAREFARRIKIPGFRPGKAPYQVIVRQVGEAALVEDALEHLIDEKYPLIIEETGIHPYGAGQLENVASMEPLTLEFIVPLEPAVTLGDYQSIRKDYDLQAVEEVDVDEVLDNLRDQHAVLEPVERPAGVGDIVTLRLSGERANPELDQESILIPESSYQFLIRDELVSAPDEWPFPGFSRELIGLSVGDSGDVRHVFSPDYEFESLRGAEGLYTFDVEDIKLRVLPELNDDFAKSIGEYDDMASLRTEIQQGLQQQALDRYNQAYDDALITELIKNSTILYPPQMVESEQNTVVENFRHRLVQQGGDLELYMKARGTDLETLKAEAKPVAEDRLKRSLVLLELAKAEDIQVEEPELQAETMRTLRSLNKSLTAEDARNLSDERVMSNLVGNIMLEMLVNRAQQRLHDIASGNYSPANDSEGEIEADAGLVESEDRVELAEQPVYETPTAEIADIETVEQAAVEAVVSQDSPSAIVGEAEETTEQTNKE